MAIVFVAPAYAQDEILKEDSSKIEVLPININSNRGDFSPFLLGNKLYFSTGRVHRYGLVYIDADTSKELEDVFYAEKSDTITFKHLHYFSEKINTKYNDGPLCFNKNGDVLFITGNDEKRMTHQMDNAKLNLSLWVDRLDRFREAFQTIYAGNENILHAAILEFRDDLHPEL